MRAMMRQRAREAFLFLLIWGLYALFVYQLWSVYDDAFISFRYARNLAEGHGPRYNLGSHMPVEGYSNFLWVMILGLVEYLHWDVVFWAPFLSFLSGSLLLWLVWRVGLDHFGFELPIAFLATLFLAIFPPYALWSSSGLATLPFALFLFLTFYLLLLHKGRHWGAGAGSIGLAVALLRVEGVAWSLFLALCTVLARARMKARFWRQLGIYLTIILVGVTIHWIWRYSYYGDLIPNTVRAKGELSGWTLLRGAKYVMLFFLTFLSPFLAIPGSVYLLKTKDLRLAAPLVLIFWATVGYAVLVGGDFMAMGRFLVPAFAPLALMVGVLLQQLRRRFFPSRHLVVTALSIGLIVLGLLPALNVHLVPRAIRSRFHFRHNSDLFLSEIEQWATMNARSSRWQVLGKALAEYAEPDASLVAGALGNVGYYSNLYLYDLFGLVSREVAALSTQEIATLSQLGGSDEPIRPLMRSPGHDKSVPASFYLDQEPTYISAAVFQGEDTRDPIVAHLETFRQQSQYAEYVPELIPLVAGTPPSPPQFLLVIRRVETGESAEKTWDTFYQTLDSTLEQRP